MRLDPTESLIEIIFYSRRNDKRAQIAQKENAINILRLCYMTCDFVVW